MIFKKLFYFLNSIVDAEKNMLQREREQNPIGF